MLSEQLKPIIGKSDSDLVGGTIGSYASEASGDKIQSLGDKK